MAERKKNAPLRHIAFIMDGNGRWARIRHLPKGAGHRRGADVIKVVVDTAIQLGLEAVTLYAFSTENWRRPKAEVNLLMKLLENYLDTQTAQLNEKGVRFRVIGELGMFPQTIRGKIERVMKETEGNTRFTLVLALSYGSRREIVEAARRFAEDVRAGVAVPDDLTEEAFSRYLYTRGIPDPDLLIRTSGEFRMSNFLLWQLSYAELYFTPRLWPDFTKKDFLKAVENYQRRERRFGG